MLKLKAFRQLFKNVNEQNKNLHYYQMFTGKHDFVLKA